jgi:hypothetical protein
MMTQNSLVPRNDLSGLAEQINAEHAKAEGTLRAGIEHARIVGQLLLQAKEKCSHGQWLPWLRENVQFSERTAQGYMRVAKKWPELEAKAQRVALLPYREALSVLAEAQSPALGAVPSPASKLPFEAPGLVFFWAWKNDVQMSGIVSYMAFEVFDAGAYENLMLENLDEYIEAGMVRWKRPTKGELNLLRWMVIYHLTGREWPYA